MKWSGFAIRSGSSILDFFALFYSLEMRVSALRIVGEFLRNNAVIRTCCPGPALISIIEMSNVSLLAHVQIIYSVHNGRVLVFNLFGR